MGREKSKKKVLIVVTGGIASYKSLDLIRSLIKLNYEVDCILTKSVSQFVAPITFSSLLGKNIFTDLFKLNDSFPAATSENINVKSISNVSYDIDLNTVKEFKIDEEELNKFL